MEHSAGKAKPRKLEERESEATSKETLDELEQKEIVRDGGGKKQDDVPAPDSGSTDRRDGRDDAGPM